MLAVKRSGNSIVRLEYTDLPFQAKKQKVEKTGMAQEAPSGTGVTWSMLANRMKQQSPILDTRKLDGPREEPTRFLWLPFMFLFLLLLLAWTTLCVLAGALLAYWWYGLPKIQRETYINDWLQRDFTFNVFSPPSLRDHVDDNENLDLPSDHEAATPPRRSGHTGHPLSSPETPWEIPSPRGTRSRLVRARVPREQVRAILARRWKIQYMLYTLLFGKRCVAVQNPC